jgi:hypothetical protein
MGTVLLTREFELYRLEKEYHSTIGRRHSARSTQEETQANFRLQLYRLSVIIGLPMDFWTAILQSLQFTGLPIVANGRDIADY